MYLIPDSFLHDNLACPSLYIQRNSNRNLCEMYLEEAQMFNIP